MDKKIVKEVEIKIRATGHVYVNLGIAVTEEIFLLHCFSVPMKIHKVFDRRSKLRVAGNSMTALPVMSRRRQRIHNKTKRLLWKTGRHAHLVVVDLRRQEARGKRFGACAGNK